MNHLSKLFKGKISNTDSINKKHPYGILRHYDNDLIHLSDERLTELVEENSRQISEERYKAMVYDELKVFLDAQPNATCTRGDISAVMDIIYKEVEEDDRL